MTFIQVSTTVTIVTIIMLIAISVVTGVRLGKSGLRSQSLPLFVLATGSLFLIYLAFNVKQIPPADWAQILLMLSLVAVTGLYTKATMAMAAEMREQTSGAARPYLLVKLCLEVGVATVVPGDLDLIVFNAGKGPATNLHAALWHPGKDYFGTTRGYLAPDKEWTARISGSDTGIRREPGWLPELRKMLGENEVAVAVEYTDIHHRRWATFMRLDTSFAGEELPAAHGEKYAIEGEQDIVELKK